MFLQIQGTITAVYTPSSEHHVLIKSSIASRAVSNQPQCSMSKTVGKRSNCNSVTHEAVSCTTVLWPVPYHDLVDLMLTAVNCPVCWTSYAMYWLHSCPGHSLNLLSSLTASNTSSTDLQHLYPACCACVVPLIVAGPMRCQVQSKG